MLDIIQMIVPKNKRSAQKIVHLMGNAIPQMIVVFAIMDFSALNVNISIALKIVQAMGLAIIQMVFAPVKKDIMVAIAHSLTVKTIAPRTGIVLMENATVKLNTQENFVNKVIKSLKENRK